MVDEAIVPAYLSFTGGEMSVRMLQRNDFEKRQNALGIIENMCVLPQGGLKRRGGLHHISNTKYSDKKTRLIPFVFKQDEVYMIELGDLYFRVYRDRGITPAFTGADLITDGSFLVDPITTNWTDTSTAPGVVTRVGERRVYLYDGESAPGDARIEQLITTVANKDYLLNFETDVAECSIGVGTATGLSDLLSGSGVSVGGHAKVFKASSTSSYVHIGRDQSDGGVGNITELRAVRVFGPSLLTNGTFDADIASWTDSSNGTGSLSWNSTHKAMALQGFGLGNEAKASQSFTTVVDTEYVFIFALQEQEDAGTLNVRIGTADFGDDIYPATDFVNSKPDNNEDYIKFYSIPFTATTTTTYISLMNYRDGLFGVTVFLTDAFVMGGGAQEYTSLFGESILDEINYEQNGDTVVITHELIHPVQIVRLTHTEWQMEYCPITNQVPTLVSGINLIANPTVDAGIAGWSVVSTGNGVAKADGGVRALLKGYGTDGLNRGWMEQSITTVSDSKYLLFFDVQGSGDAWASVGAGTKQNELVGEIAEAGTKDSPIRHFFTFTTASGATGQTTYIGIYAEDGTTISDWKNVYIDNVYCTAESPVSFNLDTLPRVAVFYQQRLYFISTLGKPRTLFGSMTGDFFNFNVGTARDADALEHVLAGDQADPILWALPFRRNLVVGSGNGVLSIGSDGPAITPTDVEVDGRISKYGTARVRPIPVKNAILYVERGRLRVQELSFNFDNDALQVTDLTRLASHITGSGVRHWAFQNRPNETVWCVLNNGKIIAMTYLRDENIVAWHQHPTPGTAQDVAVIPDPEGVNDDVYFLVKRTGSSGDYVGIEFIDEQIFVDGATTYGGEERTEFDGLSRLEGRTVSIAGYKEGQSEPIDMGTAIVSSGKVTINEGLVDAYVGLSYPCRLETFPFEVVADPTNNTLRVAKRLTDVYARFEDTASATINGRTVNFRDGTDKMGYGTAPKSEWKKVIDQGWDAEKKILVEQTKPLNMEVSALQTQIILGGYV